MGRQSLPADYVRLQEDARGSVRAMIDLLRELDRSGQLTEAQRRLPPVRLILETAGESGGAHERLYSFVLPLVLAGHETTGHTMSWALYHLGRQPDVEAALLREIETFRAAHGGALSTADYDERPLSWALLAETLRLDSPFQSPTGRAVAPVSISTRTSFSWCSTRSCHGTGSSPSIRLARRRPATRWWWGPRKARWRRASAPASRPPADQTRGERTFSTPGRVA